MFDPSRFVTSEYNDPFSTTFVPVPEGEYIAVTNKLDWKVVDTKNGDRLQAILFWEIDDQGGRVRAATGLDKNVVRQTIWLDLTPDSDIETNRISLETGEGKNVDLGKLREQLGQNQAGRPWRFDMLLNQSARVLVTHRIYDGKTFADVKQVARI